MIEYLLLTLLLSWCGCFIFGRAAMRRPYGLACYGYMVSVFVFIIAAILAMVWLVYRAMTCGCGS